MRLSTETDRVEAFTDRVLAVILAIMVLGLRAPQGTEPRSLLPTLPAIATFALSFILIGIYWNNYHHVLRASRGVDGPARGANLHLLFWLSLVPFATAWLGQNPTAVAPTVVYTLILLFCAVAYAILRRSLLHINSIDAPFASAVEIDIQGLPIVLYGVAVCTAFISPILADVFLIAAAAGLLLLSRSARRATDQT
jgi:uncharacterized membrane protein